MRDGLKVIDGIIEKIRDIISFWIALPKRKETFKESKNQLKVKFSKKTRWISTFFMFSIALMYKDVSFLL